MYNPGHSRCISCTWELEMQTLRPHPDLLNQYLHFSKSSQVSLVHIKLEKLCSGVILPLYGSISKLRSCSRSVFINYGTLPRSHNLETVTPHGRRHLDKGIYCQAACWQLNLCWRLRAMMLTWWPPGTAPGLEKGCKCVWWGSSQLRGETHRYGALLTIEIWK